MPEPRATWLREITTTAIAAIVIAAFVALIVVTMLLVGNNGKYAAMKDLLTFINPLAGVVVGFYFTKATVEPRAERAETAASTARNEATAAQREATTAQTQRSTAQIEAERARQRARTAAIAVDAVTAAADQVLDAPAAGPGVLGGGAAPAPAALQELRAAVATARRLTSEATPDG